MIHHQMNKPRTQSCIHPRAHTDSYKLTCTWEDVRVLTDTGSVCRMSGHITVTARLRPSLKREDKSKLEMEPAIFFSVSLFVIGSLVCFSRPQHLCSSCEPAVFCVECMFYIVNMKKAKSIFHHFFYCRKILYYKLFVCLCRISLQLFCIARDF